MAPTSSRRPRLTLRPGRSRTGPSTAGAGSDIGSDIEALTGQSDARGSVAVAVSQQDPTSASQRPSAAGSAGASDSSPRPSRAGAVPLLLLRAAHPRQAVVTAALMTGVAALTSRPTRELLLTGATVLVGQALLGWHNDLLDAGRDRAHATPGKPVAEGRLEAGTVWFAVLCGGLVLVPLAISNGVTAGLAYLGSVLLAALGSRLLRRGIASWVPWASSFALYPVFLSYSGFGGQDTGRPPEIAMVVLSGLLGVGVHVLRSLWGLVPEDADGWSSLPLRLGRRLGSTRLLALAGGYTLAVTAALALVGAYAGLGR